MRLTSNQTETLFAIVRDRPQGMQLKPIPSLVKHGLVVEERATIPVDQNPWSPRGPSVFAGPGPGLPTTVYRLTPLGLEVYTKLRTPDYEAVARRLREEFERDLARAKALTRS